MSDKQVLVLGGGCFWCTESVYKEVRGVTDVESGYSNGHLKQPSYEQVCTGGTGHNEVVRLEYDPDEVSTRELLEIFFVVHDPPTRARPVRTLRGRGRSLRALRPLHRRAGGALHRR